VTISLSKREQRGDPKTPFIQEGGFLSWNMFRRFSSSSKILYVSSYRGKTPQRTQCKETKELSAGERSIILTRD